MNKKLNRNSMIFFSIKFIPVLECSCFLKSILPIIEEKQAALCVETNKNIGEHGRKVFHNIHHLSSEDISKH